MDGSVKRPGKVIFNHYKDTNLRFDIFIIDDRCFFREAMADTIRSCGHGLVIPVECVEVLSTTFVRKYPARQLILFCDGALSAESVEQELEKLQEYSKYSKVVLITDRCLETPNFLTKNSLKMDGIIPTNYSTDQLLACIRLIESGVKYFPIGMNTTDKAVSRNEFTNANSAVLTHRQREIMEYISGGRSNKYIANKLSISESTIKVHVHDAMKRLGATSRTHASYLINFCRK